MTLTCNSRTLQFFDHEYAFDSLFFLVEWHDFSRTCYRSWWSTVPSPSSSVSPVFSQPLWIYDGSTIRVFAVDYAPEDVKESFGRATEIIAFSAAFLSHKHPSRYDIIFVRNRVLYLRKKYSQTQIFAAAQPPFPRRMKNSTYQHPE